MGEKFILFSIFSTSLLISCSSTPKVEAPSWIHQTTRSVDNGYIVYVGVGEDATVEKATFKSESMAMADLANECSLIPLGARIEDRYSEEIEKGRRKAYAKIGVTFEECEAAKKAIQPEEIRKLANVAMTNQLKEYQEAYYTGPEEENNQPPAIAAPSANTASTSYGRPAGSPTIAYFGPIYSEPTYFIARQQVVYVKQQVILAPPSAYPPASLASTRVVNQLSPQMTQVQAYESTHPAIKTATTGWSAAQANPAVQRYAPHAKEFNQAALQRRNRSSPNAFRQAAPSRENENPNRRRRSGKRKRRY